MQVRKIPFLLPLLLALACQGAETDPDSCTGKCDGLGDEILGGQLMPAAPEAPGTISIARSADSWLCEVVGPKGEIVLLSETYASRASALNGALSIEDNGISDAQFAVRQVGDAWGFELRAGNNQVLADSRTFATEAEATAAATAARELIAGIVQYKAAVTEGARFELARQGSEWSFDLKDASGTPILKSQAYSRRRDSITGIESVRVNGKNDARFQVLSSPLRFIVKAANGQEIAESAATFSSEQEVETAIANTRALLTSERVANPW